jgi:hypothetical protein
MAMYQPSFVDTTGFTSGITAGLNKAMEYRMRQDRLFADSMNDLRRSYDTKKMRPGDAPLFLNAFNDHKNALIKYTRVNNSNASAEDIYQASQDVEATLTNMNEIASKSSRSFEKLKQLNSASQTMFRNGIEPVGEFKDTFNKLSNTSLELLSDADIDIDPYGFKTMVNSDDLKDIDTMIIKNIPMSQNDEDVIDENGKAVSFSISVPNPGKAAGTTYTIPWVAKVQKRDPAAVVNSIETEFNLPNGEKIKNFASNQLNNLIKSLSIDENDSNTTPAQVTEKRMAEAKFAKIKVSFPGIQDIKQVVPSQMYAVDRGLLASKTAGFYYNTKEFDKNMAKIAADYGMDIKSAQYALSVANAQNALQKQQNDLNTRLVTSLLSGGSAVAPGIIKLLQAAGMELNLGNIEIINKKKLAPTKGGNPLLQLFMDKLDKKK